MTRLLIGGAVILAVAGSASSQAYYGADRLTCNVGISEVSPSGPDVWYTDIHSSGLIKAFDRNGEGLAWADLIEAYHEVKNKSTEGMVGMDYRQSYGEVHTYARGDSFPKGFVYEAKLQGEDLDGTLSHPAAPTEDCLATLILETTQPAPVNPEPDPCYPEGGTGGTIRNEADDNSCCQGTCTPLLLNLAGRSFELSGSQPPVAFDIDADGVADWIAWTRADADEAFLALDRDGNGSIDDGSELFGAATDQPASADPNGYLALAVFDGADSGGDGDGAITAADAVYAHLLLWIDGDRNGVSEPGELQKLVEQGVVEIDLDYRSDGRRDRWGNRFRWNGRASTESGQTLQTSDVIFVSATPPAPSDDRQAVAVDPPTE